MAWDKSRRWPFGWFFLGLVVVTAGCGSAFNGEGDTAAITGQIVATDGSTEGIVVSIQGTDLSTTPDADGYFTLPGVPAGQQTLSVVDEQGGMAAHLAVEVTPGQPIEVPPVLLRPAGQIAGIVSERREEGGLAPIVGARVTAVPTILVDTLTAPPDESDIPPMPPFPPIRLVAYTDADGTYALRGVPPGTYLVTAGREGYREASQVVDVYVGRTTPADFTLERVDFPERGAVKGTVREADPTGAVGQPIEGALVAALPPDSSPVNHFSDLPPLFGMPQAEPGMTGAPTTGRQDIRPVSYTALTDENGEYGFRLPAGDYLLVAAKRGYIPEGHRTTVVAGQVVEVNFALRRELQPLLRVEAATDRPSYLEAETVGMSVTVTNISETAVTLTFGGQEFDFAVFKDRVLVWRWSHGMAFPAVITTLTLQPGESKTYEATWDQTDFFGHPVAPGQYVLVGAIMALPTPGQPDVHPLRSRPFPFTIEPALTPSQ